MDSVDYLSSKFHSERLASSVRSYWRKKGAEPHVWVEKEGRVYVVRSNIRFAPPTS